MINPDELQAKIYLFDLENCAKEYWFKKDELWDLCVVSAGEKLQIEKKYNPTISKKAAPETLKNTRTSTGQAYEKQRYSRAAMAIR